MVVEGVQDGPLRRQIGRALEQIDKDLGGPEDRYVSRTTGDQSTIELQTVRRFLRALVDPDPTKQRVAIMRSLGLGPRQVTFDVSDPGTVRVEGEK